jgi:hypothetical protein
MKEKIRYKPFSIRISEKTKNDFSEKRKKSGLSWNKFIISLIEIKNVKK